MGFGDAVKKCLRDWITFSGRAPRSEYWWYVLFNVIVSIVIQLVFSALAAGAGNGAGGIVVLVVSLVALVVLIYFAIAGISAAVRRLHDRDKSGWFYWLVLIPLIGPIILLVWFCQRGTVGPNQYGEDPLGGEGAAKVFE